MDQKVDIATILPKCVTYLNNTINEIRSLSKQLSAPSLGNMNFKDTITDLVKSLQATTGIDVSVEFTALPFREMENELHLTIYRVAQEQVTNIIRYAKATKVHVTLGEEASHLRFVIADNGTGFDPDQKRKGIGITNMQSRVEILNGRFRILSRPGEGTKLEVEIPVVMEDGVCYAEQTLVNVRP